LGTLKKIAGQTAVYGLGTIIARVLNFVILTPYYTRRLLPEDYGIFTDFYAYAAVLLIVLLYGMETGFFKFTKDKAFNGNTVFGNALTSVGITSLIFFVVVLISKDSIASWLKYDDFPHYVVLLAGILAIDSISAILMAKLRLDDKPLTFSIINLINVVVTIMLVVTVFDILPSLNTEFEILKSVESKVVFVFYANLSASAVKLILLFAVVKNIKITINREVITKMLQYSWPLLISGLAGSLNETLDRIIYKFIVTDQSEAFYELGIYGANFKLAMLIILFIQMYRYAAEPFFFNLLDEKGSNEKTAVVTEYFVIFTVFVFLVITLFTGWFKFFIGVDYREGIGIVPIVVFANVLLGLLFNINFWFKLSGKTKYAILIMGTGALVTIFINILFIGKYGYWACAWAHLASNLSMVLLSYTLGRKHYPIDYNIKKIGFYIGLGLLIFFAHTIISQNMLKIHFTSFVGVILYASIVFKKEKIYKWKLKS